MSVYLNPSCSEAIHVYCVKKDDEKIKLLEQAHCAKCWRPLYFDTNWPGSHESLRPPFYSAFQPLRQMSVAQCGHIYHTQCIVESRSDNHCPSCYAWIQRLQPFHYHNNSAPTVMPSSVENLDEIQKSKDKLEGDIMELKRKISQLNIELERIQCRLDRK